MAVRDLFHEAVRVALEKEGWVITHDPLSIPYGATTLYIDLGAERLLAAERGNERIAVEIKSFLGSSLMNEFHTALGQFLNYRLLLEQQEPDRELYLAVPFETYAVFFTEGLPKLAVKHHEVKLIVYNAEQETITLWQK